MIITIVGAGVMGLAIATELAERGVGIEVIDQAPGLGAHACSWYAGGMLSPWCEADMSEPSIVKFGQEAVSWWRKHISKVTQRGSIVLAPSRDSAELNRFARRTQNHKSIDGNALAELEPDLAESFSKALYFADEAHINPRQALRDLSEKLLNHGIKIHYDTPLKDYVSKGKIINATGFNARVKLQDLRGVKGEALLLKTHEINITRPIRLMHPRFPVYIVPRGSGTYMIGATQIESEERSKITARSMVDLLNAAYTIHPAFGEAEVLEIGCDVRPAFPDNIPKLCWQGDTLHVNGLFRHGFLLAPACARMAADTILNPKHIPEFMDENYR